MNDWEKSPREIEKMLGTSIKQGHRKPYDLLFESGNS